MNQRSRIAIVGTGAVGQALGTRLAQARVPFVYGARDPSENASLPGRVVRVSEAIGDAEIALLAVPASAAVAALAVEQARPDQIVVDCTNPLVWEDGPVWSPPDEGSVAELLAASFPDRRLIKGFNHFGAEIQANPRMPGGPAEALFAGDDPQAKREVMAMAESMGFAAVDAGGLRNAGLLENLAVLWIHLSSVGGLGREFSIRLEHRA